VPQEERAQIDAVERRLAQKYADLPHDDVAAVIQQVYARFNQSTVRDYVPLLVERRATEQLTRSTVGREAVANADCGVARSEIVDVGHMATRNGARRQARIRWLLTLGVSRG
jgi:hypothetical protein